ncbi:hypothetical protein [Mycobacterium paraffinicum]|uniref:hypothetical protein n=1 Tax=Mycobacterium paraffinicum TaxID=53378 RepID=UPI0021F32553|nr:hypothetical protein [Mycobacterium paraffinicum]MCV7313081.1 hypothetical protein [Mycobacterium paraffinicum]
MSTQFGVPASGSPRPRSALSTGAFESSLLMWWVIVVLIAAVIVAAIFAMA